MELFFDPQLIDLHWVDLLDIIVVAFLTYWILVLIKGTRAVQMLGGLAIVFIMYVVSQVVHMYTLHWILNSFLSSILLIIVVLFQEDIRRALARMGRNPLFFGMTRKEESALFDELVSTASALSERHVGALLVLEQETQLDEFTEGGTLVDSRISRELLASIFFPLSPLHDGAVVIRKGRIHLAGCFLPLTRRTDISKELGSRHRAALGITENTDAVALVVSEENGAVSIAHEGQLYYRLSSSELRSKLKSICAPRAAKKKVITSEGRRETQGV